MPTYSLLTKQLLALASESSNPVTLMANASALLFDALPEINWAGFYLVKDDELLLGPFQGKAACVRIARGRGVCGTAWERDEVLVVPDVHAFSGHIACDAASRSEIVVPLRGGDGNAAGVLDIDSPLPARFDRSDAEGLEALAEVIEKYLY